MMPNFLIIGAQKSGTTALQRLIRQHPDVYMSPKKEPNFFGFEDRGVLRVGAHADVCVFEPDEVGPGPLRRVRDFPADADRLTADEPSGIRHVLVNGTPIHEDHETRIRDLEHRPGVRPRQLPHR